MGRPLPSGATKAFAVPCPEGMVPWSALQVTVCHVGASEGRSTDTASQSYAQTVGRAAWMAGAVMLSMATVAAPSASHPYPVRTWACTTTCWPLLSAWKVTLLADCCSMTPWSMIQETLVQVPLPSDGGSTVATAPPLGQMLVRLTWTTGGAVEVLMATVVVAWLWQYCVSVPYTFRISGWPEPSGWNCTVGPFAYVVW